MSGGAAVNPNVTVQGGPRIEALHVKAHTEKTRQVIHVGHQYRRLKLLEAIALHTSDNIQVCAAIANCQMVSSFFKVTPRLTKHNLHHYICWKQTLIFSE